MLSRDTAIRPNDGEVAAQIIDGEAIMINLSNGRYYSMQGIGSVVWEVISGGTTPALLITSLRGRYNADPGIVERDVDGLVDLMLKERLIRISESPAGDDGAAAGSGEILPYASPHLEVFTDMGELLALDPPLPGLDDIPWAGPADSSKK